MGKLHSPEVIYPGRAVGMKCTECGGIATIMRYPHSTVTVKSMLLVVLATSIFVAAITLLAVKL